MVVAAELEPVVRPIEVVGGSRVVIGGPFEI